MDQTAIIISVLLAVTIFCWILFFASRQYNKHNKDTRYGKDHPEDWLLHDFHKKMYRALFGRKSPDDVAMSLGVKLEEYYSNASLAGIKPDTMKLVMFKIYGIIFLAVGIVLGPIISFIFTLFGAAMLILLGYFTERDLGGRAEKKRQELAGDLTRFLDLLDTVISTGMPIQNAIYIISERFDSLMSKELRMAFSETELGASGWQEALERVAEKYNIEALNDFVVEINTAYSKGASITDTIHRQTIELRKKQLLSVKEKAGKLENIILLPIAVFQIMPMVIFLMFPALIQIGAGFI